MACALITGGAGFIGSHIARMLIDTGTVDRCVLLDNLTTYISPTRAVFGDYRATRLEGIEDKVIVERCQAQQYTSVYKLLDQYRPDFIFHLAALPLATIDNLSTDEALQGMLLATSTILEACHDLGFKAGYKPQRFVYASSSMAYGDFQYAPADEKHPLAPRNIYGTAKAAGEVMTLGLARTYKINATCIRPSAVYGPTDMNQRVTQIFIENAILGKKLIVAGRDEALDFTFVEDTAQGFVLAALKEEAIGEVFNITAGQAFTLLDYVSMLQDYYPALTFEVRERDHARPKRGTLSVEKAQRLLGYEPAFSLRHGVRRYVEFMNRQCEKAGMQTAKLPAPLAIAAA